MKIAVDLNGGDRGARIVARGIKIALEEGWVSPDQIVALGTVQSLEQVRTKKFPPIECRECGEPVQMGEGLKSIMRKRSSSMLQGIRGIKEGRHDAFVSAGETKAMVAFGKALLLPKNSPLRPVIAVKMPHINGLFLLVDAGANLEARSVVDLWRSAQMGAIYAEKVMGIKNPRVGLINIGEEETKGDLTLRDTHTFLQQSFLNFVGNVQGREIFTDRVDVAICSGWDGNLILKTAEGIVEMLTVITKREFKRLFSRPKFPRDGRQILSCLATLLLWLILVPAMPFLLVILRDLRRKISYEEIGGAILLGVPGLIVCHGHSSAKAIARAILAARQELEHNTHQLIATRLLAEQLSP